ncbi:MAG: hypothetical protein ACREI3_08900, partial [Nitrospirales bacterium]
MTPEAHLTQHLAERVGPEPAARLVAAMRHTTVWPETAATVVDLLGELHEASSKVHQAALEALPELERRGGLETVVPWLDLGIAIAGSSGAAGLKYFRESPLVMGVLETPDRRRAVLGVALELADGDPNVALDFFRQGPELLAAIAPAELSGWGEIGLDLARWDYVLGIEFLRQCAAVARVLPLEQIRDWVAFGMKLVEQNSLGKTDYMATLEFFRTSPAILGDVEEAGARRLVIHLGTTLADRSPRHAVQMLAEAPAALRRLPSAPWRAKVLQYGGLVAERDADTTLAYLRRCPEVLALVGETDAGAEKFEDWFRTGMEVLEYSPDGARAYFALETQKALASLEQAMSGVSLRQVARSVKLFVEGLCGADVAIEALPDSFEPGNEPPRPRVSPDGRTLALPSMLRRYPTREDNVRLYTVMAAHEAGHLEFGTYRLALDRLDDLVATVKSRYARDLRERRDGQDTTQAEDAIDAKDAPSSIRTLNDLFQLYPQPMLMQDLWTLLEDARIEYRLRYEYPGLAGDLTELATQAMSIRTLSHGMSARELVVDTLLRLTTLDPDQAQVPDAIADVVGEIWPVCQPALT